MPETVLGAALEGRRHGFSVIPFYPRTKKPAVGRGNIHRYRRNIASVAQVKAWFATGEWNLGIITGAVSHLLVVDVDRRNGGDQSIRGFPWPATPLVESHDGIKALFRHDGGYPTHKGALPGVDVLCERWQFLAPPSVHPQGTLYTWHDLLGLTDLELSPPPSWVLDLLHTPRPKKNQDTEDGRARVVLDTCTTSNPLTPKEVRALYGVASANRAVADFLGLPHLGASFFCLRHADHNPSMSLFADAHTQAWKVHDHHCCGEGEFVGLADIYASRIIGREVRLEGSPTLTVWWLRALLACKYLEPADVPIRPLPLDVRPAVRTVYDGFMLLLQAKWRYEPGVPTVFAVRFAMEWCGISSSDTVQKAIWWLVRHGYMRPVGRHERACTYLPGEGE
jgi:Bifunctional DNA primase/polymerase, N-terminal